MRRCWCTKNASAGRVRAKKHVTGRRTGTPLRCIGRSMMGVMVTTSSCTMAGRPPSVLAAPSLPNSCTYSHRMVISALLAGNTHRPGPKAEAHGVIFKE